MAKAKPIPKDAEPQTEPVIEPVAETTGEPQVDVDRVQDLTDAETHPALDAVVEVREVKTVEPAPPRLATDLVHTHFDNEADDGATCLCTLTFKDGGNTEGRAPRTNNLNADQAAAFAQAMGA